MQMIKVSLNKPRKKRERKEEERGRKKRENTSQMSY